MNASCGSSCSLQMPLPPAVSLASLLLPSSLSPSPSLPPLPVLSLLA